MVGSGSGFSVHEEILKRHSEVYARILRSDRKETQDGVFYLTEVDTEIFDVFASFVYTGTIYKKVWKEPVYTADDVLNDYLTSEYIQREWRHLARCWSLGDKLILCCVVKSNFDSIQAIS